MSLFWGLTKPKPLPPRHVTTSGALPNRQYIHRLHLTYVQPTFNPSCILARKSNGAVKKMFQDPGEPERGEGNQRKKKGLEREKSKEQPEHAGGYEVRRTAPTDGRNGF